MTVAFIASLPKSGSTLLELILSGHERCIGLGEVYEVIRLGSAIPSHHRDPLCVCTCGELAGDCDFWGPLTEMLRDRRSVTSEADRYQLVLNAARKSFGADRLLIDSSKTAAALHLLSQLPGVGVKVIHLIKDVRAWSTSHCAIEEKMRRAELRKRGINRSRISRLQQKLEQSHWWAFRCWYRGNRALQRHASLAERYQVSYERLCMESREVVPALCTFLDLQYDSRMLHIEHALSHNISGNRMRFQATKRTEVRYDSRWFHNTGWVLPYAVLSSVRRYNLSQVYGSHGIDRLWNE